MIRALVDFALNNRLPVLAIAILTFVWGIVSFRNLPIEAYPDVANNYVNIITQWPGRAAEEVEQQVTIPIEIVMNGLPHLEHLRSTSLFGLSSLMLILDDVSTNDSNRQKTLERLSQVTLPPGLQPVMGTDWSPVGQIYFYTLRSTNPKYDVMELKSIEDWILEKQFKSVPNVVDVSSLGGMTREYQVRIDPGKLVSYGLAIDDLERQLSNNNVNAGGSFIEAGLQQVNVRAVGLVKNVPDIERTVITTKNGTPLRVKDIAIVSQGPRIRLGRNGKAIHRANGRIVDNDDVVEGIVLLRKGAESDSTLDAIHAKVKELNDHILPHGVKVVPFLDRSDLVHYTTHTVEHSLTEGIILVAIILFLFLGNARGALIVALTIPFAICFYLSRSQTNSGESAVAWRAGFRHGRGRCGCDGGKHRAPYGTHGSRAKTDNDSHSRSGPRSAAACLLCDRNHHHGIPTHLHATERRRAPVQANGLDRRLRAAGRAGVLHAPGAGAIKPDVS